MWLPVTITPARPVEMACETNAGVGILPAFSTWQPESRIAWAQARMMRSVLGRRSPAMTTLLPRTNIANAQQIPERSFDIDIGLEVGDILDQAAQSAGAKGQRDRRVIKKRSRGGSTRCSGIGVIRFETYAGFGKIAAPISGQLEKKIVSGAT